MVVAQCGDKCTVIVWSIPLRLSKWRENASKSNTLVGKVASAVGLLKESRR